MDRQTDGIENRASSAEVKRFSIDLDEKATRSSPGNYPILMFHIKNPVHCPYENKQYMPLYDWDVLLDPFSST